MAMNIKAMKSAMVPNGGVTYTPVPPGWMYDAMTDGYINGHGLRVTQLEIMYHGSITQAIIAIHGIQALQGATGSTSGSNQMASAPGANGPAGRYSIHSTGKTPPSNPNPGDLWNDDTTGEMMVYTSAGWVNASKSLTTGGNIRAAISSAGNLSVSNGQSYTFANPLTNVIQIETKVGRVGINIETGDITIPPGIGRDDAIREFWLGFQKHFRPSNKLKYEQEIYDLKKELASVKSSAVLMKQESEKQASKRVAEKVRKKYGNEKFIMLKPEDLIKFIEEA